MSDLIRVIDLEVLAQVGVPAEERREKQRLLVSLELSCHSFAAASESDDIAKTIDYAAVCQCVGKVAEQHPRKLIETLAEDLAAELLRLFSLEKVTVEIKKFILPDTKYVSIVIERSATKS